MSGAEFPAGTSPRPSPWLGIVRASRLATDARKLILATLGLVALALGWQGLDRLFAGAGRFRPPGPGASITWDQPARLVADHAGRLADPIRVVIEPAVGVFKLGAGPRAFLHAALALAWAAIVWGLVGGAIARIALVEQADGEGIGITRAFRFAARKALPLIGAPVCPWLGIAILAAPCALLGLLYRVPGSLGPATAGALAFLPLLAALVMALILIGLAAGWPLMVAAVAAEGEDAFDALSRSYSYVFQRSGRALAYAVLAWIGGVLGWLVVRLGAALVLHLAAWALAFGAPDARVLDLAAAGPAAVGPAAAAHQFWRSLVDLLAYAWIYSYFWSAAAIIYLQLRLDVDGTPRDEIDRPDRTIAHAGPADPNV